ncbi:MAG TPA: CARDB domain-containing protein [Gemmatimonadales bacterium]|nr:CARDB domain-containing protein [Gemmatimonadales bacterium]
MAVRTLSRRALVALLVAAPAVWYACSDRGLDSAAGPSITPPELLAPDFMKALAVQRRHTDDLLAIPGVVGTAITRQPDGHAGMVLLLERAGIAGLPQELEGVPVGQRVTGRLMAFSDPTRRQRPAPMGFSVGHPAITAGTIGARVRDALGRVYILSNNHVLANSNGASIGDPEYQPGPFDGGTSADQIATLTDFQVISFASNGSNTIDAAIALSSTDLLDNAVPSDDGYGMPNSKIYGDSDGDGFFDDRNALLGLNVQKYGRTTRLTHGQITGVNATVTICYEVSGFTCTKTARYVDQLIISPGTFSGGGDSGSLIVTDDANLNPVALLFAGSPSVTIGNRIDLVLNRFGVTIDGSSPPPPGPLTDVAITSVSGPSAVVVNNTASVTVTVKNFGNQDVSSFDVILSDTTDHVTVGTQTVPALAAGAVTTLTFAWSPATAGDHVLAARHTLSDDKASNDQRFGTIPVTPPITDISVTNMSVSGPVIEGHVVTVTVFVANVGNQNVTGSFDVTLQDSTAGVTLGTQTVAGLAVGAKTTLTFSWDLTAAAVGVHTLVATQSQSDDNAANNRRTVAVNVNPKPTDIALTGITAPARVGLGDTAHVVVTVKNVGEVDVGSSFNVVLTDGTNGNALVGTQTVSGLAIGASTTVDFPWNTAGASTSGHILFATSQLADANSSNNAVGVAVIVNPPADIAVTSVSAPASVIQGGSAAIAVTVQNVGGQNTTSNFDLTLSDATTGLAIGTQTIVGGLFAGGSTTRTFNWNTATASLGSHTLVAAHTFTDVNGANNQASVAVTISAPSTDVAVTALSAPASVGKGSTATISVTVQNVAVQNVTSSFNVVLTDATSGATIGTQAVASLAVGATATRSFSWNTASAALGNHTLVASHTLTDDNTANNQRSATVNVTPQPADLALAGLTAPGQVTIGDTAPIVVTVQNVGGEDVATSFDVVLTDGTAGNAVVGTQTFPGLALGASATATINWNTAGVATAGHILIATQKLPDANSSNNARAIAITVNPPSVHVGNIDGFTTSAVDTWSANARVTAHDSRHNPLNGVTVRGSWNSGPEVQCVTADADGVGPGTCVLTLSAIPNTTRSAYFGINGLTLTGYTYKPAANHDPDGSSNGYSIFMRH